MTLQYTVYHPEPPHAQSLFLFPIVFGTVKLQIFVRYLFSYFRLETGSYVLIFVLSRVCEIQWLQSKKKFLYDTREMQGIVGQASDFVEVVSKIDWILLHEIWWRKIEKNQKRLTSNVVVRFSFLREHISPRTSSTVVRVQLVGVCEVHTLVGMSGLVIVLDPACACQWERRRTLKKGKNNSTVVRS